jgi:L-amino acid N-acyltransferase YncA
MFNSATFRITEESDLQTLLGIYNYYITNSNALWDDSPIPLEEFKNRIPIGNGKYRTYNIYIGSIIVGFCSLKQFINKRAYDRTAEIGIYLKPEYIGKGIGQQAIAFLENIAAHQDIKVLIAGISGDNSACIKMFKKLSYIQCGCLKAIGEKSGKVLDGIYLQKEL